MSRRFVAAGLLVAVFVFGLMSVRAYAGMHGDKKDHGGGLESKFSCKAGMILRNKEELSLTDEQMKRLKELKVATKKDLVRKNADIDILAIDIKSKLWEETIDTEAINALIDRKYEIKKAKAKALVAACAELKRILTEEQIGKLKALKEKCRMQDKR